MGQPISGKHAIEAAVFMLAFERPFQGAALDALSGLQSALAEDFPVFQKINVLEVRIEGGAPITHQAGGISGVSLQRFRPDGRPAWSLRADGNAIVVTCTEYDTWDTTAPQALAYLNKAASAVLDEQNPLALVVLQVIDRFVRPSADGYDIKEVFNPKSRYLTRQAADAGRLWHVHQGWFEDHEELGGRFLNVLNLSTNDTPSGVVTTIEHTAQLQAQGGLPSTHAVDKTWCKEVFDALHVRNKDIVSDLLNAKQRKAIKL